MRYLQITVRFLDERYHGLLARNGPPEWPPSPFRLFCALVAGVARHGELDGATGQVLHWLQDLCRDQPPMIIAPRSRTGNIIVRYGPDNDDKFHSNPEACRSAKPTMPTLMLLDADQEPEVHYLWDLAGQNDCPLADIERAARSLTTLGWGVDMAFADARLVAAAELNRLIGLESDCPTDPPDSPALRDRKWIVWYPKKNVGSFGDTLRVPTYDDESGDCTLCDLRHCHSTFINRIEHGKPLKTVDKPKVFDRVLYTSIERPVGRPCVVFRIECDDEMRRFSYPQSKLVHIAGMVRHLAIKRMRRNPPRDLRGRNVEQWVEQYVAGHRDQTAETELPHTQFSYIPLQSIGMEHTDPAVRRVMIVAPLGDEDWLEHLARHLDGQLLKPLPNTHLPPGTRLEPIADNRRDGVRDKYLLPSRTWASVTPVILPGHDDHKPAKTRKLIEKALAQSGIEQPCEFEWSAFSHFRKMLGAHKYVRDESAKDGKRLINYIRPDHLLNQTTVHLHLTFEHEVPGPLTVGAGRHCGFGLMAEIEA